jgi:hypothetical protein
MDNTIVYFQSGNTHYGLVYPEALQMIPITKLKRLFQMMLSDWRTEANAEAVRMTQETLENLLTENKAKWDVASVAYQRCYVDPDYRYGADKKAVMANNKRLLRAVKSARAAYERVQKLLTFFEENRAKYLNDIM